MSKLLLDLVGKKCKIVVLGVNEIKGTIIDFDDQWIKFQYGKKEKIRMIKRHLVSSIFVL